MVLAAVLNSIRLTAIFNTCIVIIMCLDFAESLKCWHCIAENCSDDPAGNYKATKKECTLGQSCQKVYFEMYSPTDKRSYFSTVRGCSSKCDSKDDFLNCSTELKNSRGCIRKLCCQDDLCNDSNSVTLTPQSTYSVILTACLIGQVLLIIQR